jgi:glycosyltransferase involved in cell wall biosynthesis
MFSYAVQQWATDLEYELLPKLKEQRVNILAPCGYSALSDRKTIRWPKFEYYYRKLIPTVIPLYDAVVYHSSQYQDYEFGLDHGFTNSVVIHNGVDDEEFTRKTINFREKFKITTKYMGLCVGNFYGTRKRQDRIIECVRQMNRPDFTMVLVGKEGPPLKDYKEIAQGLNVRFLTDISREDTVAAYHAADLFLLGSDNEASPLVIIEAKASKTPFVSTDCGNVREWKGGIVCPPERMAHYANRLIDDRQLYETLARDGWNEWKEKLTWEKVVDKYEELYLQLHYKKTKTRKTVRV